MRKDEAALGSMRKYFEGLRQCGEAWGSMGQHGAAWGSMGQHGAAWGSMRKHFKGLRQSEEA